ncbi:MAG: DUF397 domain-containing protein [Umezawaea sp.]
MITEQTWRKSSYSGNENACVELAVGQITVGVRDSKRPDGPALTFAAGPFRVFLAALTRS